MTTSDTERTPAHAPALRRRGVAVAVAVALAAAGIAVYLAGRDSSTSGGAAGWNGVVRDGDEVVYEFHDASVAPDYHRSYTVTVRKGSARLVVDSYGDVLHDVEQPIDDEMFEAAVTRAMEFADANNVTNDDCAGGTAEELTVLAGDDEGDEPTVHVFIDHCDTSGGANIVEAVGEVLPLFDLDTLLATG